MTRRRKTQTPFSLFAFQDIITSITGIMILITLLIALELVHSRENSPQHQTPQLNTTIQKQLQETNAAITQLNEQLRQQSRKLNRDAVLSPETLKSRLQAIKENRRQVERRNRELAQLFVKTKKRLQKVEQVRVDRSSRE